QTPTGGWGYRCPAIGPQTEQQILTLLHQLGSRVPAQIAKRPAGPALGGTPVRRPDERPRLRGSPTPAPGRPLPGIAKAGSGGPAGPGELRAPSLARRPGRPPPRQPAPRPSPATAPGGTPGRRTVRAGRHPRTAAEARSLPGPRSASRSGPG